MKQNYSYNLAKCRKDSESYKNHNFDQCVCVQFKRTLKYFFKGFYDENNPLQEYVKAIEIEKSIIDT